MNKLRGAKATAAYRTYIGFSFKIVACQYDTRQTVLLRGGWYYYFGGNKNLTNPRC